MRNSSALLSCKFMDIAPESQELLAASTADAWSPPPPGAFQGAPREHHQEGCPSFSRHSSRAWAQRRLRVCRWSRIFYRAAHVEATACWGEPGTFPGPPRGQHHEGRVIPSSLQHLHLTRRGLTARDPRTLSTMKSKTSFSETLRYCVPRPFTREYFTTLNQSRE